MPATSVPRLASGRRARRIHGLTFHGLRHSAADPLIALGALERMGHSSSRVTRDVYGHVLPMVDDAVTTEIDRLFRRSFAHGSRTKQKRRKCLNPVHPL